MSTTAKVDLEGKLYEFPTVTGSEGEKAIDIAVAEAERMWSSAIERHFIRKVA